MITPEQMLDAVADPQVRSLKTGAFSPADVVNLILQRSEIICDQPRPGRVIKAWTEGDASPALALVDRMGDELIKRAAAIILLEYRELSDTIRAMTPRRVADIGCGYAIFDLFLWQDCRPDILRIDLEQSDDRHFGFRESGSAYSNLDVAKGFLTDNGIPPASIRCINPQAVDVLSLPTVDLAISFISCGFHYPVDTYVGFFDRNVTPRGCVILDLRARKSRDGFQKLGALGTVSRLTDAANGNAHRVILRKN